MAINIKFDVTGNSEPPSIILATKNGNKLGLLNVNADSIELNDKLKISEISFTLNKYIDGKLNNLWDKVVDFKLVWCKEWDCWFEIKVELDEATETVKTVFGTQLGQAELSQIMVYNMEVNTEEDIARDDYKITILYDENDHEASLLHRILKDKAPHYSIAYVDPTIARIQRQFSWDGSSICDVLDEIEEEIGCLVVYNSNSIEGGIPNRSISVYDLEQNCNDCGHRGEFTDKCPKCGSTNIKYGYGEDTTIFVTNDELASEGIQLVADVDSVKNCFKLEAGDDLMTATIRNCNPNGSDYIWRFSNDIKEDMSDELVEKLESYDAEYKRYYNEHESNLDATLLTQYNNLVEKYDDFYNTDSTCLNCDNKGEFYDKCPSCDSENLLTGKELQKISTPIVGYPSLMNAYYNTIDFALYLESGLMPSIAMSSTTAEEQASLLTTSSLSPVAVNVKEASSISPTTADSAVLSMAKVIVRSTYKVEILSSSLSTEKKWSGTFKITSYSDDSDTVEVVVNDIEVNNNAETFIKQKIEKALNKEDTDDYSISGLFEKEYDEFCTELTKYALNPLQSFYDATDACISILTEQGAGDETNKPDLYKNLYLPYFQKQEAIASEINIRKNELAIIEGIYDETTKTTSGGLQNNIRNCQSVIQDALNFEDYLGEDLWKEFCSFRREDKYSNSNYISDGLNNAQLFERALEFFDVAENEIYKSSELQHSISTSLNNLLAIDKFKPLVKYFKNGNWIRVRVDDKIYKLRLLEYDINFGNFENIPVEFSDVTKIKNSITDVQNVLEQASSVASSYDAVTRQAKKGNVAKGTIEQWIDEGLNAANVQIQSNDSEEIIITKNGLLGRSYDDITGTYSPEQLKITHNIMAYTDDNWETVSSALGKHSYKKWSGSSFVDDEGYGLTSKFVTAGYITGSQIIGGEILSSNYQIGESGTYLNLIKGDFDFAGGKIVYDADKNRVTLSGVEIQWDSVNKPTVENIDGLSGITEDIRIIEQGLQATTINGQYVISPHIVGGDLKIIGDNGANAQISNTGVLTATGANITGDITATSLTLTSGASVSGLSYESLDDKPDISQLVNDAIDSGDIVIETNEVEITTESVGNGITKTTTTVGDNTYTTYTSDNADYILTDLGLGTNPSSDSSDYTSGYFKVSKEGLLIANNAMIWGTIYATNGEFTGSIKAGSTLYVGEYTDKDGNICYNTWIDKDGILNTQNAKIQGTLTSSTIIGGTINGSSLNVGKILDEEGNHTGDYYTTITDDGYLKSVEGEFENCTITGGSLKMGSYDDGYSAWISSEDGVLHAYGAYLEDVKAVSGAIGGYTLDNNILYAGNELGYVGLDARFQQQNDTLLYPYAIYVGDQIPELSPFRVKKDGECIYSKGRVLGDFNIGSICFQNLSTSFIERKIRIHKKSGYTNLYVSISAHVENEPPKCQANYYKNVDGVWSLTSIMDCDISDWSESYGYYYLLSQESTGIKSGCSIVYTINNTRFTLEEVQRNGFIYDLSNTETWAMKTPDDTSSNDVELYSGGVAFFVDANNEVLQTWYFPLGVDAYGDPEDNLFTVLPSNKYDNVSINCSNQASYINGADNDTVGFYLDKNYLFMSGMRNQTSINVAGRVKCSGVSSNDIYIYDKDSSFGTISFNSDTQNIEIKKLKITNTLYDSSGTVITSDKNVKNSIHAQPELYSQIFDRLEPVTFKYNDGTSSRIHTGFVAQDVEQAVLDSGLTTQDFAAVCYDIDENGNKINYGIRYGEIVSMCVNEIQKLKKRVDELENK